jgi:hypothetical protein
MSIVNVHVKDLRKTGCASFEAWTANPNNIYIGRQSHYVKGTFNSIWANPYPVKTYGRDECLRKYKDYIVATPELMKRLPELQGKTLGCWCSPEPCHGNILLELLKAMIPVSESV